MNKLIPCLLAALLLAIAVTASLPVNTNELPNATTKIESSSQSQTEQSDIPAEPRTHVEAAVSEHHSSAPTAPRPAQARAKELADQPPDSFEELKQAIKADIESIPSELNARDAQKLFVKHLSTFLADHPEAFRDGRAIAEALRLVPQLNHLEYEMSIRWSFVYAMRRMHESESYDPVAFYGELQAWHEYRDAERKRNGSYTLRRAISGALRASEGLMLKIASAEQLDELGIVDLVNFPLTRENAGRFAKLLEARGESLGFVMSKDAPSDAKYSAGLNLFVKTHRVHDDPIEALKRWREFFQELGLEIIEMSEGQRGGIEALYLVIDEALADKPIGGHRSRSRNVPPTAVEAVKELDYVATCMQRVRGLRSDPPRNYPATPGLIALAEHHVALLSQKPSLSEDERSAEIEFHAIVARLRDLSPHNE